MVQRSTHRPSSATPAAITATTKASRVAVSAVAAMACLLPHLFSGSADAFTLLPALPSSRAMPNPRTTASAAAAAAARARDQGLGMPRHRALSTVVAATTQDKEQMAGDQDSNRFKDEGPPVSSILPYFKIKDWAAADPIMEEFEALAKALRLPAYGWTKAEGDTVAFATTFPSDPKKLVAMYFDEFSPLIDRMLERAATMDRLEIHGAPAELDAAKREGQAREDAARALMTDRRTDAKGARAPAHKQQPRPYIEHFEAEEGWFTNMDLRDERIPKQAVNVNTYFTLLDEDVARPLVHEIIEQTRAEGYGCLYFGWHREDDKVVCQGCFRDGQAAANHFGKIDPLLKAMLRGREGGGAGAAAKLETVEVHGRAEEMAKVDAAAGHLEKSYGGPEVLRFRTHRISEE